jgi:hypothetical protein
VQPTHQNRNGNIPHHSRKQHAALNAVCWTNKEISCWTTESKPFYLKTNQNSHT